MHTHIHTVVSIVEPPEFGKTKGNVCSKLIIPMHVSLKLDEYRVCV